MGSTVNLREMLKLSCSIFRDRVPFVWTVASWPFAKDFFTRVVSQGYQLPWTFLLCSSSPDPPSPASSHLRRPWPWASQTAMAVPWPICPLLALLCTSASQDKLSSWGVKSPPLDSSHTLMSWLKTSGGLLNRGAWGLGWDDGAAEPWWEAGVWSVHFLSVSSISYVHDFRFCSASLT